MAGINRLGKGAPKPGTLRPTDPNRFKTQDFFSKDADDDPEYLRAVLEVEETTLRQGYLAARGAFDKGDLLYLRDESEKQRNAELELRDVEVTAFSRLRSQMDDGGAAETGPGPPRKKARPHSVKNNAVKISTTNLAVAPPQQAAQLPTVGSSPPHEPVPSVLGLAYDSSSDGSQEPGPNTTIPTSKANALAGLPGADELLGELTGNDKATLVQCTTDPTLLNPVLLESSSDELVERDS